MSARPSPPNKSLQRKTLGKGGSQMNIPRLTGNGIIMAGELDYYLINSNLENPHDFGEDEYQIILTHEHSIVYGLMIYHLLVSVNQREITLASGGVYHIDVSEFEIELDGGKWEDHPKEFIIYFYGKISKNVDAFPFYLRDQGIFECPGFSISD